MAPEHKHPPTHKTKTSVMPILDIVFPNILPRLPGKSASRFKLVSKQWNSFLSSSIFTKLHHDHNKNHPKLLFFSPKTTTPCVFHSVDCEALENGLSASRSLPFVAGGRPRSEHITFLSSCNGLVCVGIIKDWCVREIHYIILWNPLTGEYKKLPWPHYSDIGNCYKVTRSASVLYHCDSEDTYKLLRLTQDGENIDAYIYSLLSDSWRKLNSTVELKHRWNVAWGASIIQNGKVYISQKEDIRINETNRPYYSIIRFDLRTEEFTVIASPCFGDQDQTVCLDSVLLQKDGQLHLCVVYKLCEDSFTKLWRMDGDGDWTEVVTYGNKCSMKPLHLMKNGNWITVCQEGCHVNELDPVMDFKKISSYAHTSNKIDMEKKGIYIETFVSPNQKMK